MESIPEIACRTFDNDQSGLVVCDPTQSREGTSYASAAVAGAALLVRDFFQQGYYPNGEQPSGVQVPAVSGALVKATLVASADWVGAGNAPGLNLTREYRFNNEQGYGRVQLDNVLPLRSWSKSPSRMIVADGGIAGGRLDIPGLTGSINTSVAQIDTGTFQVCDDTKELRIALAWIDPYNASGLLDRNLDLELIAPSNKVYYGNYFTDDNNRSGASGAGENCPNGHLTGSATSKDDSPFSLETCANSVRDNANPTEAIMLSPDARNDGSALSADKQTEIGTWTVKVRTGVGTSSGVQRYAVVVSGGVCASNSGGVSVSLDQAEYPCKGQAKIRIVDGSAPSPSAVQNGTAVELLAPSVILVTPPFAASNPAYVYDSDPPTSRARRTVRFSG
jgi:hypothetical protein